MNLLNLFASIIYFVDMKVFIFTFNMYVDISVICHLHVPHFTLVIHYKRRALS